MYLILFCIIQFICLDNYNVNGAWVSLNASLEGLPTAFINNSQRVELGDNGRRMAVGSPNDSILIYDLVLIPADNDKKIITWKLLAQLNGVSGTYFSLSPNGQFLASRHESVAKQVQVWKIESHSSTYNDESSSSWVKKSNTEKRSFSFENIGTFWCVADGRSVKLSQSGSKLYLAMSCETWLSNRGKVQVFIRDLSLPINNTSKWDYFFPSLEGRNDGDLFGAALSIAEAPSQHSGYEFRLAIGSPGFNHDQGLVVIYTASYSISSGWVQMGGDLTGSKAAERFGASLDISGNINEQPFLIVGSPGWKDKADNIDCNQYFDRKIDEEFLSKSIGTGLVRLYHWRKSSSDFRSPRRWTPVGNAMSGRDEGDQFGIAVAISRTGERIAIAAAPMKRNCENNSHTYHQGGYIGVYERVSFDSWGKVVNDIISCEEVSCGKMNQNLALNDQGSLVVSALSDGTVGAFIDDSPFCHSLNTKILGTNITSEIPSSFSYLNTLLDRQTCRKSDSLVDSRSLCLEQSVFMKGDFEPCSWQNISVANYPSLVLPTIPALVPSSMVPSSSPSQILPILPPATPSMVTQSLLSFEPSKIPEFPTISFLSPEKQPQHGLMDNPVEPSIYSNDITTSPTSLSVLPTPLARENLVGSPISPSLSAFPSIYPSLSPVNLSRNKIEGDNYTIVSKSCLCDTFDECIDQLLSEHRAVLKICVYILLNPFANVVVSFDDVELWQDVLSLSLIASGAPIHDVGETKHRCERPFRATPSLCTMETFPWSFIPEWNHSSTVFMKGNISVEESPPAKFSNRGFSPLTKRKIPFLVPIHLSATNVIPRTRPTNLIRTNRETTTQAYVSGIELALIVVLVLMFCGWMGNKFILK